MSFESVNQILEATFHNAWSDTTPAKFPNIDFRPDEQEGEWVQFENLEGPSDPASVSGKSDIDKNILYRYQGILLITVFGPLNTGTSIIKALGDQIASIYQGKQFTANDGVKVKCLEASITTGGQVGAWFTVSVTVNYYFDQVA